LEVSVPKSWREDQKSARDKFHDEKFGNHRAGKYHEHKNEQKRKRDEMGDSGFMCEVEGCNESFGSLETLLIHYEHAPGHDLEWIRMRSLDLDERAMRGVLNLET